MITLKHISNTVFAVAILSCVALSSNESAAAIYSDGFNAAAGNQNNTQFTTTLAVQFDPASSTTFYDNWTASGFVQGHAVDLNTANAGMTTGDPENLPNPNQWAGMLISTQVLTSNANIAANNSGEEYAVDFVAGPAVYAADFQRSLTANGDGLTIDVIDNNGTGAVIGTTNFTAIDFDSLASALDLGLSNGSFTYTGSGVGDVKLRISGFGSSTFHGSIDTISISEASVIPEPGTFALAALGLLSLFGYRPRKNR